MISFILLWIASIITFLIGYALGKGSITKQTFKDIKTQLEHKTYPQYTQPSGMVKRPSAERLRELNNPKQQEEVEEMRATLQKGIEPLTR